MGRHRDCLANVVITEWHCACMSERHRAIDESKRDAVRCQMVFFLSRSLALTALRRAFAAWRVQVITAGLELMSKLHADRSQQHLRKSVFDVSHLWVKNIEVGQSTHFADLCLHCW